jgi:hypothetical protein
LLLVLAEQLEQAPAQAAPEKWPLRNRGLGQRLLYNGLGDQAAGGLALAGLLLSIAHFLALFPCSLPATLSSADDHWTLLKYDG